jgi:predicted enzyme related to lactoylglutathione lyase
VQVWKEDAVLESAEIIAFIPTRQPKKARGFYETTLGPSDVVLEQFEGMGQDQLGIWTSPSGAKIAWFKDPDGNILSVTEWAAFRLQGRHHELHAGDGAGSIASWSM